MRLSRTYLPYLILALSIAFVAGCQSDAGGQMLLPEPPKDQVKFAAYEPANSFREFAPGVLSRRMFDAAGSAEYAVEAVELLIAPGQRASNVSLPGGAVFEVRSGTGMVSSGGKRDEMKTGSSFALSEGASFAVENTGEVPMTIRAIVIRAR